MITESLKHLRGTISWCHRYSVGLVNAIVVGKVFLEDSTFKQAERRKARL